LIKLADCLDNTVCAEGNTLTSRAFHDGWIKELSQFEEGRGCQDNQGSRGQTKEDREDEFHGRLVGPGQGRLPQSHTKMIRMFTQRGGQLTSQLRSTGEDSTELADFRKINTLGEVFQGKF
jgi:hypothetical protein